MSGPGLCFFDEEEERSVAEVLQTRELSRYRFGKDTAKSKTLRFESEFAEYLGVPHCLGMNSCTSALFAGLLALGLPDDAEVIVPGYTFVATLASVMYAGARPVFAEVDESLTIDVRDVAKKLTSRTAAVIAVHMLGAPSNLEALGELCRRHDIHLIEDVAQAAGGSFRGRALGSFGTFGAFSLNHLKTFTGGDGGVLATSSSELFETAFAIHDHGSRPYRAGVAEGGGLLGLNLRMHEMSGALALVQARKLPRILSECRARKRKLIEAIGPLENARPIVSHDSDGDCGNAAVWLFDEPALAQSVAARLNSPTLLESPRHFAGHFARTRPRLPPRVVNSAAARDSWKSAGELLQTEGLLGRSIALSVGVRDAYLGAAFGVHPRCDDAEIERVAAAVRSARKSAGALR